MAAFYQKCRPMGIISNSDCWFKDHPSSTETIECSAGSNCSPTSPLELAFERNTQGVTVGLGLVPYLARLWLEDPFETRIVFGINMGVDHFSKSLIEGSTANAFETYSPNPIPPRTILTCSSTPSSLLSPASHIPQIGSPPAMQPIFEPSPNYGFDLNYYHFTRNNESYQNSQSAGSDVLMGSAPGSEASLFSSGSSEYIFGSLDDIMGSQIALQEEYTRVVSRGVNPMTTHIYNNRVLEARPDIGGLSATFGNAANRPPPMSGFQYPTAAFMSHCNLCRKPLDKERNDIFIFKGEYAYCGIPCRQVDIDMEEERDKAEIMAQKQAAAKRLASYGKSPVLFEIGRTSSS